MHNNDPFELQLIKSHRNWVHTNLIRNQVQQARLINVFQLGSMSLSNSVTHEPICKFKELVLGILTSNLMAMERHATCILLNHILLIRIQRTESKFQRMLIYVVWFGCGEGNMCQSYVSISMNTWSGAKTKAN